MAQMSTALYKNLADSFHAARNQVMGAEQYLEDAVDYVVDVTSGIPSGLEIELAILEPTNDAYISIQTNVNSIAGWLSAVRAINNYIIENSAATAAQISRHGTKLTVWIKVSMDGVWDNGCVPYYWEELSHLAGFDTGGWPVCPSA